MSTLLEGAPVVVEETDVPTPCDHDAHAPATWSWLWSCGCVSNFCDVHDAVWREATAASPNGTMCAAPHRCQIHLLMREPIR